MNLPFLKKKTPETTPNTNQQNNIGVSVPGMATSTASLAKQTSSAKLPETAEKALAKGIPSVQDIIAPSAIEVDYNYVKIGDKYFRTLFVSAYPRFVGANWLEPIINFDHACTVTMFYYPMNARNVLDDLRRKIAEMEATLSMAKERGRVVDPAVQAALGDAKSLQEQLVKGIERFFHFSFYITLSAPTLEELNNVSYQMESTLGSLSLISKKATLDMENAFKSTLPLCLDRLKVIRNMDTTSVATTFPFTSSELTANEGILYGINKHNGSLIIFDRFSLENANAVIFAKSGSGKSYFVKLEALRSLLFGTGVIVLDPETEYKKLCEAVGGDYIDFSINTKAKINPFELSVTEDNEDNLSMKILSLHALLKIMLGDMSSAEAAVLDRALIDTYRLKGITQDPASQQHNEPPLMEDLYKTLQVMEEPESKALAARLERFVKGSLAGIFDQRSNLDLSNDFTVFSIRNLQDVLRPIAMFMILDFIWTKVKYNLKRRMLILDEAWTLMQYPDSAAFVYSLAKRARKYYLGLTTITQDVNDFLNSDYGKAVVTNSSIQVLLKQHPASMEALTEIFYLSGGERNFLLSAGIGEGLFFAGTNHVAMSVKASKQEHALITTNPAEVMKMQKDQDIEKLIQQNINSNNLANMQSQAMNNNSLKINTVPNVQPGVPPVTNNNPGSTVIPVVTPINQAPINTPTNVGQVNPYESKSVPPNNSSVQMPNPMVGEDQENNYTSGTIMLNPNRNNQE